MHVLPPPSSLRWSHATNSLSKLDSALSDPTITAIEADIMMGHCTTGSSISGNASSPNRGSDRTAIMSHPPYEQSDLSAERFLFAIFQDMRENCRKRHIKLDFKEMEAVGPVLNLIATHHKNDILHWEPTIFLNADILEGPGVRGPSAVSVQPGKFLNTCLSHIEEIASASECSDRMRQLFAFSLGYKVNYKSKESYTSKDARNMAEISREYNLNSKCGGIVLALNARTLALNPAVFDEYFINFANSQILAWTGAGEEPILQAIIDEIRDHFAKTNCLERIGFDCDVAVAPV